eukprot:3518489-Rhodomonas_salina.2
MLSLALSATQCPSLTYGVVLWRAYALCGTELGYAATAERSTASQRARSRYPTPLSARSSTSTAANPVSSTAQNNAQYRSFPSRVRNLQKQVEKLLRKCAYKITTEVEDEKKEIKIDDDNLQDFVGRCASCLRACYAISGTGIVLTCATADTGIAYARYWKSVARS